MVSDHGNAKWHIIPKGGYGRKGPFIMTKRKMYNYVGFIECAQGPIFIVESKNVLLMLQTT